MSIFALVLGILGGLCAVMGIITATTEIIPSLGPGITDMFWFIVGIILFLAAIAIGVNRGQYE